MNIVPMTAVYAVRIARWQYDAPYDLYSFDGSEETQREVLGGGYYAALDAQGELCGYFCFGADARIPVREQDVYDALLCDMGLGMAPDRCGAGGGTDFVRAGAAFARASLGAGTLRLAVAAFNKRAVSAYEGAGFAVTQTVAHARSGQPFYMMLCSLETQK